MSQCCSNNVPIWSRQKEQKAFPAEVSLILSEFSQKHHHPTTSACMPLPKMQSHAYLYLGIKGVAAESGWSRSHIIASCYSGEWLFGEHLQSLAHPVNHLGFMVQMNWYCLWNKDFVWGVGVLGCRPLG